MKKLVFLVSALSICMGAHAFYTPRPYTDTYGNQKVGCQQAYWVSYYGDWRTIPPLNDGEGYDGGSFGAYCSNGHLEAYGDNGYLS